MPTTQLGLIVPEKVVLLPGVCSVVEFKIQLTESLAANPEGPAKRTFQRAEVSGGRLQGLHPESIKFGKFAGWLRLKVELVPDANAEEVKVKIKFEEPEETEITLSVAKRWVERIAPCIITACSKRVIITFHHAEEIGPCGGVELTSGTATVISQQFHRTSVAITLLAPQPGILTFKLLNPNGDLEILKNGQPLIVKVTAPAGQTEDAAERNQQRTAGVETTAKATSPKRRHRLRNFLLILGIPVILFLLFANYLLPDGWQQLANEWITEHAILLNVLILALAMLILSVYLLKRQFGKRRNHATQ